MNQEFVQAAASHSVRAVMRYLGTRLTGLSAEEVETQRSTFGVNTVTREKKKSIARRLVGAFVNPFTMILCVLALVSTWSCHANPYVHLQLRGVGFCPRRVASDHSFLSPPEEDADQCAGCEGFLV